MEKKEAFVEILDEMVALNKSDMLLISVLVANKFQFKFSV